jgi:DNA-3-methyladenine glycosylase II
VKYRGIGPWTAGSFLLFGLGRPNLFPLADIGLQNALKKLWTTTEKPKAEEISSHFPQWSPYLSYASLYLWRSIE